MTRERKQLVEFFAASWHPFLGKEKTSLAFLRVYDHAGNVIETYEHKVDFKD